MSTRTFHKLVLNRETLRTLSSVDLGAVHGGGDTRACTITIETRQCEVARLHDKPEVNDTVYRPGCNPPAQAQNDTVYRGGGGRIVPV